jgi:hypothetical protein
MCTKKWNTCLHSLRAQAEMQTDIWELSVIEEKNNGATVLHILQKHCKYHKKTELKNS